MRKHYTATKCPCCHRLVFKKNRKPIPCAVCGKPVEQPHTGRARLVCESKSCQLARKYEREGRVVNPRRKP
jgi:ribosomal protein S27E